VRMIAEGIVVVREIVIAARPETVWQFLVDPEKMVRWMGIKASIDPRLGGRYAVEVIPGAVAVGELIEIDPPRRLVHTWGWAHQVGSVPPGSTTVEFELIPEGEGTLLRLTHRRLPGPVAAHSQAEGWAHYLARLVVAAAGRDPGGDPWIKERAR
jgi:uncharacterized protein YndB with AHSA1/START domain